MNLKPKKSERGIALLVALFALILLAAVGLGMMFSTNTETGVNLNYRETQQAYFAARSGLEEVRDRMRFKSTDPTAPAGIGIADSLPSVPIGQPNGVLYITNGNGVAPWDARNQYFDDELCHETSNLGPSTPDIKCGPAQMVPNGAFVQRAASQANLPGGTALQYKWSRVTLKLNESSQPWCVLGYGQCNRQPGADQICYNGQYEVLLSDLTKPIAIPDADGVTLPSELASMIAMYGGGSTTGHSAASTSSSGTGGPPPTGTTTGGPPPGCGPGTPPLPGNNQPSANILGAASCVAANTQPVYTLTALAVSNVARARRMLQYEVAHLSLPPVPSALTIVGPNPTTTFPNSIPYHVNGNDGSGGQACSNALNKPSVGAVAGTPADAAASQTSLYNAIPSNRLSNYTGSDACAPGTADVQNVNLTTASAYTNPTGLLSVIQTVLAAADQTFPGGTTSIPNLGTTSAPRITAVTGDLSLSGNISGAGILLVTGTLTISGNFSYDGVILVIGAGVINALGGGGGQINGAVLTANIYDPAYGFNPDTARLLKDPSTGQPILGSPTYNWAGGGGNGIYYNSCTVNSASQYATFKVLAKREITY